MREIAEHPPLSAPDARFPTVPWSPDATHAGDFLHRLQQVQALAQSLRQPGKSPESN